MSSPPKRPWRILLVDDDPLVVKVYAERMRYEGWSVSVARDGWEACQECRESRFDLILLDIRMPFHNGVEVLKEIRCGQVNTDTLVYILTSLTLGDDVDDALRLGADGVFYKADVRPEDLVIRVQELLGGEEEAGAEEEEELVASSVAERHGQVRADGGAESDPPRPRLCPVAMDPASTPKVVAESSHVAPRRIRGEFDIYVNPFLGDGASLFEALGLTAPYQCPECGGQIFLRVSAAPEATGAEVIGDFLCSHCKAPV